MGAKMEVREITIHDYEQAIQLWRGCQGICLHSDVDSEYGIGIYLARNPGLSFVAIDNERIVGAVLCCHDGRRGYLHHLAVAQEHRRSGIGTVLVGAALEQLRAKGVRKCNTFVFDDNHDALDFWNSIGWAERDDLKIISKSITL